MIYSRSTGAIVKKGAGLKSLADTWADTTRPLAPMELRTRLFAGVNASPHAPSAARLKVLRPQAPTAPALAPYQQPQGNCRAFHHLEAIGVALASGEHAFRRGAIRRCHQRSNTVCGRPRGRLARFRRGVPRLHQVDPAALSDGYHAPVSASGRLRECPLGRTKQKGLGTLKRMPQRQSWMALPRKIGHLDTDRAASG